MLDLKKQKQSPGEVMKKAFFKISQNLQESTCAGVFFSIKLQDGGLHLYQIETPVQVLYSVR